MGSGRVRAVVHVCGWFTFGGVLRRARWWWNADANANEFGIAIAVTNGWWNAHTDADTYAHARRVAALHDRWRLRQRFLL